MKEEVGLSSESEMVGPSAAGSEDGGSRLWGGEEACGSGLRPCWAQLWSNCLTFLMWLGNITLPCWFSYDVGSPRCVVGRWVGGQEQTNPVILVEAELSVWAWRLSSRPEGTSWVENGTECWANSRLSGRWDWDPGGEVPVRWDFQNKLHLPWCFGGKIGPCSLNLRGCF